MIFQYEVRYEHPTKKRYYEETYRLLRDAKFRERQLNDLDIECEVWRVEFTKRYDAIVNGCGRKKPETSEAEG